MAWIKRNLIFVITVLVGLGVSGYCGYLLYSAMQESEAAKAQYESAQSALSALQHKKPFPSNANIEMARADAEQGQVLLAGFQKNFARFPTPPKMDDRSFNDYLHKVILQFGTEATNAGVALPANYQFTFSRQMDELDYPPGSIDLWMQQLQEMQVLLHILFDAKINYLELIKRPSIGPNDVAGDEVLVGPSKANSWGEVSSYMVSFRAFSKEIADVLAGIASSSNCFVLTAIYVSPSRATLPQVAEEAETSAAAPSVANRPQPQTQYQRPVYPGAMPGRRGYGPPGRPPTASPYQPRIAQSAPAPAAPAAPAAPTAPETILGEKPLFVTIYIDLIKLNKPAVPQAAANPRMGGS
jgi:hypothetical protein